MEESNAQEDLDGNPSKRKKSEIGIRFLKNIYAACISVTNITICLEFIEGDERPSGYETESGSESESG